MFVLKTLREWFGDSSLISNVLNVTFVSLGIIVASKKHVCKEVKYESVLAAIISSDAARCCAGTNTFDLYHKTAKNDHGCFTMHYLTGIYAFVASCAQMFTYHFLKILYNYFLFHNKVLKFCFNLELLGRITKALIYAWIFPD